MRAPGERKNRAASMIFFQFAPATQFSRRRETKKGFIKLENRSVVAQIPKPLLLNDTIVRTPSGNKKPPSRIFVAIKPLKSKHAPRHSLAPRSNRTPTHARSIEPAATTTSASTATSATAAAGAAAAVSSAAPAILRTRVPPEHEHGFAPFFVELFEEEQGFFFQAEAALLVAVHDVEGVLPPVVVDVVAFEGLRRKKIC